MQRRHELTKCQHATGELTELDAEAKLDWTNSGDTGWTETNGTQLQSPEINKTKDITQNMKLTDPDKKTLCYDTLCYATPRYFMLCYATLSYVTPRYTMPRYVTQRYTH